MEPEKLGEPMQKVSDKRRSCYFWKKGACLVSKETNKRKVALDGHKKERPVRRLFDSWCLFNSTGEDLRLVEV